MAQSILHQDIPRRNLGPSSTGPVCEGVAGTEQESRRTDGPSLEDNASKASMLDLNCDC